LRKTFANDHNPNKKRKEKVCIHYCFVALRNTKYYYIVDDVIKEEINNF